MFRIILFIVMSLLKASTCVPSIPVRVNDPGGHRCYSCPSVEDPYLCNVTTQCRHDEQCYTDEYSTNHGASIFSVGCRRNADCHVSIIGRSDSSRRDVKKLKCEECCRGNLCNGGGCSAGIGKGNVCYSCNLLQDPRHCKHEIRCQANEHCYIEKVYTQQFHIRFNLGCVENAECERLRQFGPLVGKRDQAISTMCASCCYGDRCNDVCFFNGSQATTRPLMTTDTTVIYTTEGVLYTSTSINVDTTPVYTTELASYSSPSQTTDTTIESSVNPLMDTDSTFVYTTSLASSSSPSTQSSATSSLMDIDTTLVDTASRMPPISPSMSTTAPVLYTGRVTPSMSPSVGTETFVLYPSRATPSISRLMSTDATIVDIKIEASSSKPQRISTAFLDLSVTPSTRPSMNTDTTTTNGVQSSFFATATVQELSTMRHGVTAFPFTSTTRSPSIHDTSPGKDLSTLCHADCDGIGGCLLAKIQTCSGATPYCFTQVDNTDSGDFNIKKSCADRTACNTKWWQQTSDDSRCVGYKSGIMDTFTCFYCCTADTCNLNNIQPTSLFKGDD